MLTICFQYCNDSTLKNVHWALCTGVFGKRDVGRIEREFLDVLDYELTLHESDILAHHDAIMSLIQPPRLFARSHQAPRNHHRSHTKMAPTAAPSSHWSDSSDSGSDASTTPSTSPMPETPRMDVEPTFVPALVKQSPEEVAHPHRAAPHPTIIHADAHQAHGHKPETQHRRISSALQLLRSFPIPHFHHSSSTDSPLSASSTSSNTSSSNSSAASIPRCKPVAYPPSASRPMVAA